MLRNLEPKQRGAMMLNLTPRAIAAGRALVRITPGAAPHSVPTRSFRAEEQRQRDGIAVNWLTQRRKMVAAGRALGRKSPP